MQTTKIITVDQSALIAQVRTIVRQHVNTSKLTVSQITDLLNAVEAGVEVGVTMGYDLATTVFNATNASSDKRTEFQPFKWSN